MHQTVNVTVTTRNYFCPLFACLTEKSNGIKKDFCTFAREMDIIITPTDYLSNMSRMSKKKENNDEDKI